MSWLWQVFYQEHAAGMYGVLPFALAQAAAELPYLLAQNCLYCFTLFWMAGFDGTLGRRRCCLIFAKRFPSDGTSIGSSASKP